MCCSPMTSVKINTVIDQGQIHKRSSWKYLILPIPKRSAVV